MYGVGFTLALDFFFKKANKKSMEDLQGLPQSK